MILPTPNGGQHRQYQQREHMDPIKPNLIFSSNILHKIYNLIHHHVNKNDTWSITINIRLNNLVSRDDSIKLSDLEDLINIHSNKHYILQILKNEPWEYRPYEEIFIVMVKLVILRCTGKEEEGAEEGITFEFEQDENYFILKHCHFLEEIEEYMKKVYHKHLQDKNRHLNDYDASDSTLECSEVEDNGELEGKVLEPLKSNDTLIDEFKRRFSDVSDQEKTFRRSQDFINNISNLRHNDGDDIPLMTEINGNSEPVVNNQQQQELPESQYQQDISQNMIPELGNPFQLDDLVEVDCEHEDEFELKNSGNPNFQIPVSPTKKVFDEDDEIIKISRQLSFQSPTKSKRLNNNSNTNNVSRMSSFSMIGDDRFGLDFAFNSDGENVPLFIKDNKKFKFIKVGKVQKFVNLFEEQQQKELDTSISSATSSRKPSRRSSRATSPLK